jgi:hypothetical protein
MRRFELTSDDGLLLERYLAHAAAVDGYAATTIVQRKVGGWHTHAAKSAAQR